MSFYSDGLTNDKDLSSEFSRESYVNTNPSHIFVDHNKIELSYPSQYLIAGIEYEDQERKEGRGKEIYGGDHSSEYLRCSWKNETKNGEGLLYNGFGELLFRGTFVNDFLEGFGYFYHDGAIALKCLYKHSILQLSTFIECTENHIIMVEQSVEGIPIYKGGFHEERMERDGYGAEYENGLLSQYCIYENNMVIRILKRFNQGIMREFDNYDNMTYCGEYLDSLDDGYPRQGEGREFDQGVLTFHGNYRDGKRHGCGTEFYPHGIARLRGKWEEGVCVESQEVDRYGYYVKVKNDGRSTNSIRVVDGVETVSTLVEHIRISDNMGNSELMKTLRMDDAKQVVSVEIGNGCFTTVTKVSFCALPRLEKVKIGSDSFTQCNRDDSPPTTPANREYCLRTHGSFVMRDCGRLRELTMEMGSFSSFSVLDLKGGFRRSLPF